MKLACITGASSGIGKEFAYLLSDLEYDLILVGRNSAALHEIADNVAVRCKCITCDLSDEKSCVKLAKNLYFTQEKKMERKVAEVFMAFALERDYSKNEILELYVNTIYFGNGYYCIKDASEGYFGKEPEDLTDYESTLLAGVPNAPSKYSPTVNLELAEKRQEQVVERLVACGLFTKERALETLAGSEM